MIKHEQSDIRETWFEETMDNGLHAVVFWKPDFTTTSAVLAVPYGSLDCRQVDDTGKEYSFPEGSAHFLEHKLFESGHGDAMNDFARLGATVNAFTSYDETAYYFDTPGDACKPLEMLLDFVQDLSITDASVEKEKGIILQERHMYLQDAESRILLETMRSLYQNHPIREDITGSDESISSITRKQLEACYAINYHPGRMTLVVTTPEEPQKIFDLVRRNQASKAFGPAVNLQRFPYQEGKDPLRSSFELSMDISLKRVMFGIRIPVIPEDSQHRLRREWSLRMLLDSWFTSINPDFQKWIDEGRISPYFAFEEDFYEDAEMLVFADETEDPNSFRSFVEEQLQKCIAHGISSSVLDQLKRRTMGTYYHIFNDPAHLSLIMCESLMDHIVIFEEYAIVSSLTPEACAQLVREMNFDCSTLTVLNPLS